MNTFQTLHEEIADVNSHLAGLLKTAGGIPETPKQVFDEWEKTCRSIERQVSEETLRVAIVGAIKSGKSTFANSLLNGDYLKRGAGVVTSIVTRVRHGKKLEAHLHFKSWDEVNGDMAQALSLLPPDIWSEGSGFDIRSRSNREDLEKSLGGLGQDAYDSNGFRNANSVVLASYLKGYPSVEGIVSSESLVRRFDESRFAEHLAFVGDDALAVYLHDVQLVIPTAYGDPDVEIADCQGSDSPNPLHLAMIQDYLRLTHLIVYVISSRTGLRQADIRFLSIIKKMGLLDQILFVANCDFNEHDELLDLERVIGRINEELSLIRPHPDMYALSALHNLYKAQRSRLSRKEEMLLSQWESEGELIAFSDRQTDSFLSSFRQKLTKERFALLVNNHLSRLSILTSGLSHWAQVNWEVLTGDAASTKGTIDRIVGHQQKMTQIDTVIRNALDGAAHQLKEEIKGDIERLFSKREGTIIHHTLSFIRQYDGAFQRYRGSLDASGFANTLYLAYQDFKGSVDRFIAEEINPTVIRFVREKEIHIGNHLDSVASQYDAIVRDTLAEYDREMKTLGMARIVDASGKVVFPDIDTVRSEAGLMLPISVAAMRYSAKTKTEATVRLGMYYVVKLAKQVFKLQIKDKHAGELRALEKGLARMKRDTESSIASHFVNQKENIKFQYFFRLVDEASKSYYQRLLERFQIYADSLTRLAGRISKDESDKQRVGDLLQDIIRSSEALGERIGNLKATAESEL